MQTNYFAGKAASAFPASFQDFSGIKQSPASSLLNMVAPAALRF